MLTKTNKIIAIVTIIVILLISYSIFFLYNRVGDLTERINILESVEVQVINNIDFYECMNQTIIKEIVNVSFLDELNITIQDNSNEIRKLKDKLRYIRTQKEEPKDEPEEEPPTNHYDSDQIITSIQ